MVDSRLPTPNPDESQPQFAIRFHAAMMPVVPNTAERNKLMFQAWRRGRGQTELDRLAKESFGHDHQFRPHVPQFQEHSVMESDDEGREYRTDYDREKLAELVEHLNYRISDNGRFSPLSEGHTPDEDQSPGGREAPRVLGYAGPFYLGMSGNKDPRWTIFADEWHDRQDADVIRKRRRRSPEVWTRNEAGELLPVSQRFFDPIATLGATTPRLDMGPAAYHRATDGKYVTKYAAVFAGAPTGFVPSAEVKRSKHERKESAMQMDEASIAQIVEAIKELPELVYIRDHMMEGADEEEAPLGEAPVEGPPDEVPAEPPPVAEPDEDDNDMYARYMAGEADDDEYMEYMRGRKATYNDDGPALDADHDADIIEEHEERREPHMRKGYRKPKSSSRQQYRKRARQAAATDKYAKIERRLSTLEKENRVLKTDKARAERYSRLVDLQRKGYSLDIESEVDQTDPSKMDDKTFELHVGTIEKYARKAPIDQDFIEPAMGTFTVTGPTDDNDVAERAKELALEERRNGNNKKGLYKTCYERAKKEKAEGTRVA